MMDRQGVESAELLEPASQAETADWTSVEAAPASARERILSAATFLFCHKGFSATGVDAVVERAGAAKTTLYKHFESKEQLIEAVLEREGAAWRRWFFDRLRQIEGPPRARLLAVFDVLYEWFDDPRYYGCPFINAIAEFETTNDRIRETAAEHKSHLNSWLHAQALEMGDPNPTETVRAMIVLIDGAIVASQASRDPSFAMSARSVAERVLPAR